MLYLPFNWVGCVGLGFFLDMMKTVKWRIPSLLSQNHPSFYALLSCHLFSLSAQQAVNPPRQGKAFLYFLIWNPFETQAEKSTFLISDVKAGKSQRKYLMSASAEGLAAPGGILQEGSGFMGAACIQTSSSHFILTSGLNQVKTGWSKMLWS